MGMCTHESPNKGLSDDWWTPLEIVQSLGVFDLDPCGNLKHKTATVIYEDKGIEQAWFGRVWMNPPYSQNTEFVDKFIDHKNGVALLFARTDTKWCQKLMHSCDHIFLIAGRLKFEKSGVKQKGNAGAPSALFYFGEFVQPNLKGIRL